MFVSYLRGGMITKEKQCFKKKLVINEVIAPGKSLESLKIPFLRIDLLLFDQLTA
jgi:hypothetical protein